MISPNPEALFQSRKRTLDLFRENFTSSINHTDEKALRSRINTKINSEYGEVKDLPAPQFRGVTKDAPKASEDQEKTSTATDLSIQSVIDANKNQKDNGISWALVSQERQIIQKKQEQSKALMVGGMGPQTKPTWHTPWKLFRVISGHLGWVRAVAMDPSNEWFVTGSGDRTIKIWDLASGNLKLTLLGHINTVRGLAVSAHSPYLFSCAEDKIVNCWDLEQNKIIRKYHGHLSGVYCLAIHPTLDILVTGGRDSSARVWDIRTKSQVHILTGHQSTVASVVTQAVDPQIITGSNDSTIRLWDIRKGNSITSLTHHKKSVRSLALHPGESTFVSASPDNIKQWKLPEAKFLNNLSGHNGIIHSVAVNRDNVCVSSADDGSMYFWDWRSGYNFQKMQTVVQPGSLESEAAVMCSTFDLTGSRLICGEGDKSIKMYKEDDEATPESHPIDPEWKAALRKRF
eukprot:TRINITY_DN274_c0_g1_i1.p1 TRINITY_DN274_c0_g1~~TRINITY_DN274_c0_g1_i1.p1  ORF type:complete len:485 (-),score=128.88 TRINITY_DN274_c0_g1_i1:61-1437(-)